MLGKIGMGKKLNKNMRNIQSLAHQAKNIIELLSSTSQMQMLDSLSFFIPGHLNTSNTNHRPTGLSLALSGPY